jgi:histidinol-phosphate/aromatic aminotransferase/cobyric acid decarboxylase-like protein
MENSEIKKRIAALKENSGSHSPSISTLISEIPEIKIEIDACFLSNPYATDLFMEYLFEISGTNKLRDILEYYPPQNNDIRKKIAKVLNTDPRTVFVGNGAIEVIQACMHRFAGKVVALPIPTFSSYYEFAPEGTRMEYYELNEENDYNLDVQGFSQFIRSRNADSAIIINPNNPVGNYLTQDQIVDFLEAHKHLELIIVDESFLHFAFEDEELGLIDNSALVQTYPNLVLVKSMSKDFGIAGIRAGYGIMSPERVDTLMSNGYLWNINGMADYFYELYGDAHFRARYEEVRKKYISETKSFIQAFLTIDKIKVYPSKANFVLVKLPSNVSSFEFCVDLLIDYGIYLRDCSDKIGLKGGFVRVASRTLRENNRIIMAFKNYFKKTGEPAVTR